MVSDQRVVYLRAASSWHHVAFWHFTGHADRNAQCPLSGVISTGRRNTSSWREKMECTIAGLSGIDLLRSLDGARASPEPANSALSRLVIGSRLASA
jgi:hypothetical protein